MVCMPGTIQQSQTVVNCRAYRRASGKSDDAPMSMPTEKIAKVMTEVMAAANADGETHEAIKRMLADLPIVVTAVAKALTPMRVLQLTTAIGQIMLRRGAN